MNEEIISRIQKVIDHYGLTVSAFADAIGVQRSSISHLLNGRNKPSLDFIMKLIIAYPDVDLYWLLKGEGEFPQSANEVPIELDMEERNSGAKDLKEPSLPTSRQRLEQQNQNPVKIVAFYPDGTFQSFNPKND